MSATQFERLLQWYSPAWRSRYGDELVALMEDTFAGERVPLRDKLGIVCSGISEHLREIGLEASGSHPGEQVRAGSLLVLCAWALFVIASGGFAKFAEHWDAAMPQGERWLPGGAYHTVAWAGGVGAVVVLVAGAVTLPAFTRFVREGGWTQVRRPVLRALVVSSTAFLMSIGVIAWAHHIGSQQHNGGWWPHGVLVLWALVFSDAIGSCTAAAVSAARRLQLSPRVLRLEGLLALLVTLAIIASIGGTLVWWGAVATDAPRFFSADVFGAIGSTAPLAMIIVGLLMLAGLVIAISGAGRVARSIRAVSPS